MSGRILVPQLASELSLLRLGAVTQKRFDVGTKRIVVSLGKIRDPKSVRLKDRDYDVTPNIIAHMYPQISNGSVKECEVEMVGEECEVYCEDGRRRVLVLTGHAGRVAPISPMLKRRISCGLEILN